MTNSSHFIYSTYTKEDNQFYKCHRDKQFSDTKQRPPKPETYLSKPKRITIIPHVHVYALPADSVRTRPYVFNP